MTNSARLGRLETEIELAQKVQGGLLPKAPPSVLGLGIWTTNQPELGVGGDFYDFISNGDTGLTFVVGDVCGKGMSAAMVMTMVRKVIRMVITNYPDQTPWQIIEHCSRHLLEDLENTCTFATIFLARYRFADRNLVYVNAGHSPVIYCPLGGPARLLPAGCEPLGILETPRLADSWLIFQPGDVLVIGTDGLTEAYDPLDVEIAHKRLIRYTEEYASCSARDLGDHLLEPIKGYQKAFVTEDDQFLCVIKGT